MRKIKFWAAMALLIFVFMSGGCGGSASSDSDGNGSTLHTTVSNILTGRWTASNYESASGTATVAMDLRDFTNFNVVFSDIEFASDSNKSAGNANVYYSVSCSAYESGAHVGDLNISSVSSSSNFAQMVVTRGSSDNEWIFTHTNGTKITVNFASLSSGEDMTITISGSGTLSTETGNSACTYTVTNNLKKTSSSTDVNDDDASALHTTITSLFTGTWSFDDTDEFNGRATTTADDVIRLYSVKNFKLSMSDIVFDNNTADSNASVTVFYSYTSSARYEDETTSLGDSFSIKSYLANSSVKTQEMTLSRISDEQWSLSSSSSGVPGIIITRSTSRKITVQFTGTVNFATINQDCTYTITASMVKSSDTPSTDDSSDDYSGTSGAANVLNGTWKFSAGDDESAEATATSNSQGTSKTLTLKIASGVELTISNIVLSGNTQLSGTAHVVYKHNWTAYYDQNNSAIYGTAGQFKFSREESEADMKIIQESNGIWRLEDTDDEDQNIVITIDTNNQLSTVWNGIVENLTLGNNTDSYTYLIKCTFKRQ